MEADLDHPFLVTGLDAQLITLSAVARLVDLAAQPLDRTAQPEVERLICNVRVGGTFSALLLVAITLLMGWKPGP